MQYSSLLLSPHLKVGYLYLNRLLSPPLKVGYWYFARWSIAVLFIFLQSGDAAAQYVIQALPRWMVSFHGEVMIPRQPVNEFLDGDQWGYRIEAQYRIQYNKPFMMGGYFNEAGLSRYVIEYTNNGTNIKEKANTRRLETGMVMGFYPEVNWLLQPYIQGRFGVAIFTSSSILTDLDADELIDRFNEFSTAVNAYGVDFGVHIVPNIWYIRGDVRLGIVANPSTKFLSLNEDKEGTVQYPIEAFDEHVSSGRWFKISVGVSYLF